VSYSSPAAAALSVLSIPPMIVMTANGSASGRYFHASDRPPTNSALGQGTARWSAGPEDVAAAAAPTPTGPIPKARRA